MSEVLTADQILNVGAAPIEQEVHSNVMNFVARVNWENVFIGALATTCTLGFGLYTYIFAMAGGWWWAWAVPYAVLTLITGGFAVWCFANVWDSGSVWF